MSGGPRPGSRRALVWGLPALAAVTAGVILAVRPPGAGTPPEVPVTARPSSSMPPPGLARIPIDAAAEARGALERAAASRDPGGADYLAFRRAVARAEPFFRACGPAAEVLAGGGPADEDGGALGRLDAAMEARDAAAITTFAGEVSRALLLLQDTLSRSPGLASGVADLLPRAVFRAGAALAGSKPGLSRVPAAAVADTLGLLDAVRAGTLPALEGVVSAADPAAKAGQEAERVIDRLRAALTPALATGEVRDRAALILLTGQLGVHVRAALAPLGKPWRPYSARVPVRGNGPDEAVTVLTVPSLPRWGGRDAAEEGRLVALGERLFFDMSLSAGGARACATCHVPEKGYADGEPRPASLVAGTIIERNTPTLLYAPLQAAQLWDGRALTSERQAVVVMHSKAEMGVEDSAFPRAGAASMKEAAAALSAFQVARLVPASSPADRFARGDEQALSDEDRTGFDVLAGKGRCTRCHVPPLFGGAHPPDFATAVYSALGVPADPAGRALDEDRGRAVVTRREADVGAFKTPTLRNVERTAPYFHNGAFPTLESVVDFYDKGGGKGLGLAVPNQDVDIVPLRLTAAERRALLRFLRVALSDVQAAPP